MPGTEKEFHYTKEHFDTIRTLVFEHTGITMPDTKSELIYGRISRRLRKLKLNDFYEYCDLLRSGNAEDELGHFVNSVTTNLTSFFRESHHFDYLKNTILPNVRHRNQLTRRIRIWSAGCSTGKEPYSIAISLRESGMDFTGWDVKILATDIDTNVLDKAKSGIYDDGETDGLSKEQIKKWFIKGKGEHQGELKASRDIQNLITFKPLNLMDVWPMKGMFDVVFCRNVVIYFNKETQKVLFKRIADKIESGSYLILGHSESLFNVNDDFRLLGKTIYERK